VTVRFLPAGRRGVLVEVGDLPTVMSLDEALRRTRIDGVVDVVPAARTVLVTYRPPATHRQVAEWVCAQDLSRGRENAAGVAVEIEVVYDGEDLAEVAELAGMATTEVVRVHQAADYRVAFVGFAPGFAYIAGGDPRLHVPRRSTPRTQVPAGSVAVAGEFTGIYPREGPGGWRLLGRTDATLWDLNRDPPALLPPGTPVRFVERSGR
jgi:KipI family sensor histidine kinase inhibitor